VCNFVTILKCHVAKIDSPLTEAWRNFAIYSRLHNDKDTRFVRLSCMLAHRSLLLCAFYMHQDPSRCVHMGSRQMLLLRTGRKTWYLRVHMWWVYVAFSEAGIQLLSEVLILKWGTHTHINNVVIIQSSTHMRTIIKNKCIYLSLIYAASKIVRAKK
jgi:hypothetical protein